MAIPITPRPRQPDVTGDDPFADDALERKPSADILTEFVSRLSDPYVIAIDSPWGTGKTTFIQMWQAHLKREGFNCVSFNAWKSDFTDDPFTALVGELSEHVESLGKRQKIRKAFERARKAAIGVSKRVIPVGAKLLTVNALDLDKLTEEALSSLTERIAKEALDHYSADKNALSEFRTALAEAVDVLRSADAENPTPLIFIIDELDRCRPTYALALLERAKHLFDVPGIVFVLAIDKGQLQESIKSVYGSGINANAYLRRFIDIDYRLPPADRASYVKTLWNQLDLDELLSSYTSADGFNRGLRADRSGFLFRLVSTLCAITEMSLREQIQCISRLSIVIRTIPHKMKLYDVHLGFLCVLREWAPDQYRRLGQDPKGYEIPLDLIRKLPGGAAFLDDRPGQILEAALVAGAVEHTNDSSLIRRYENEANGADTDEQQRKRSGEIVRFISMHGDDLSSDGLMETFKRIEMASGFFSEDYEPKTTGEDEGDATS